METSYIYKQAVLDITVGLYYWALCNAAWHKHSAYLSPSSVVIFCVWIYLYIILIRDGRILIFCQVPNLNIQCIISGWLQILLDWIFIIFEFQKVGNYACQVNFIVGYKISLLYENREKWSLQKNIQIGFTNNVQNFSNFSLKINSFLHCLATDEASCLLNNVF